jgi:hypothetical protein
MLGAGDTTLQILRMLPSFQDVVARREPGMTSYKKLCGSTSMSSLIERFGFGAAASQSRR